MTIAEDLAYLAGRIPQFEDFIADWAAELRELEAMKGNANLEIGRHDVKAGAVVDTWRQPRPVRYRSKKTLDLA